MSEHSEDDSLPEGGLSELLKRRVTRRKALATSAKLAGAVVATAVAAGSAGYFGASSSTGGTQTVTKTQTVTQTQTATQTPVSSEDEEMRKLVVSAENEGKVVFYASITATVVDKLVAAFQAKYPKIKVESWRESTGPIITRVNSERLGNKDTVDVMGVNITDSLFMINSGWTAKYQPFPSLLAKVRDSFKTADGAWVGLYGYPTTICYNKNLVSTADAPKNYEDLLDPKWKGKLAMDPTPIGPTVDWFIGMKKIIGEDKWLDYMTKLSAQNIIWVKGHTTLAKLNAAGEFPIVVNGFIQLTEEERMKGANVGWVKVNRMFVNSEIGLLYDKAPHPNAAKLFINYLIGPEGQQIFSDVMFMPVREDIQPKFDMSGITIVPVDLRDSANAKQNSQAFTKLFGLPA